MAKLGIQGLEVAGRRVLVRVDFNVPLDKAGEVADDSKIRAALPTINYLLERSARVILCSHLGRPDGKVVEKYRLDPVAERLAVLLGREVVQAEDCVGPEVEELVRELEPGEVLLLENLRFHPGEEKNDQEFARQLASLADLYVNDAFGAAHRAHASTAGVAAYLPAAAGFLMLKELEVLGGALSDPQRPFVAVLGGAKVSDKIGVISNLLGKVDALLIGGGMANTFLKARGWEVGHSLLEEDRLGVARQLLEEAGRRGVRLLLPADLVVAERPEAGVEAGTVAADGVPGSLMALDIGPQTREAFAAEVRRAGTVFWNGPLGVFEVKPFDAGTIALAKALAECRGVTIVGGGDSVAAVEAAGVAGRITHLSTGGGASLEFLEGKKLPGVEALKDA